MITIECDWCDRTCSNDEIHDDPSEDLDATLFDGKLRLGLPDGWRMLLGEEGRMACFQCPDCQGRRIGE